MLILGVIAAKKIGKPVIIEEFGLNGIQNKTTIYPKWVKAALDTGIGGIMPWQWGQLGLTEGNRNIKYADDIWQGVSFIFELQDGDEQ
jgi:mannan endo-1,4-beta-mannosidase